MLAKSKSSPPISIDISDDEPVEAMPKKKGRNDKPVEAMPKKKGRSEKPGEIEQPVEAKKTKPEGEIEKPVEAKKKGKAKNLRTPQTKIPLEECKAMLELHLDDHPTFNIGSYVPERFSKSDRVFKSFCALHVYSYICAHIYKYLYNYITI